MIMHDPGRMSPETLAAHLRAALCTESGRVLKEWLSVQCYMRANADPPQTDPLIALAAVNARRDLFINLESIIKEKANNVRFEQAPLL